GPRTLTNSTSSSILDTWITRSVKGETISTFTQFEVIFEMSQRRSQLHPHISPMKPKLNGLSPNVGRIIRIQLRMRRYTHLRTSSSMSSHPTLHGTSRTKSVDVI